MALEGVYSVLPTAFSDSGDLDLISKGVNGLTARRVTGEEARLDDQERVRVLETVITQTAGRVPVAAGTTAEGTRACIAYSHQAKQLGAAAVTVRPPRMATLNSEAVVRHYKALADVTAQKGLEWISV